MRAYVIRRLLLVIPTVFLLSLIIFFLMRILPGDIIDAMMAAAGDVEFDRAVVEHQLGLDAPQLVQYGRWLGVAPQADGGFSGIFQGSLGTSWWTRGSVMELERPDGSVGARNHVVVPSRKVCQ